MENFYNLTEEQLDALKDGRGCVVRNPIPMEVEGMKFGTTHIEEGSTITVAGKSCRCCYL